MRIVAKQRDDEFISDVSIYERHMLMFVDETGTDRRDSIRRYGYSTHGRTPQSCKVLVGGELRGFFRFSGAVLSSLLDAI